MARASLVGCLVMLCAALVQCQQPPVVATYGVEVFFRGRVHPYYQLHSPGTARPRTREVVQLELVMRAPFSTVPTTVCGPIRVLLDENSAVTRRRYRLRCAAPYNQLASVRFTRVTRRPSAPDDLYLPERVRVLPPLNTVDEPQHPVTFPIYRWLLKGSSVTVYVGDTFLPQNDPDPTSRAANLALERDRYELTVLPPERNAGIIPFIANPPSNEFFDEDYINTWGGEVLAQLANASRETAGRVLSQGPLTTFQDAYRFYGPVLPVPEEGFSAHVSDRDFALQRLQGVNPYNIFAVTSVSPNFRIDAERLNPLLEEYTFPEALEANKIFLSDLSFISFALNQSDGEYLPAPSALFFLKSSGELTPIAVQTDVTLGRVFYPSDNYFDWVNAKMWFNLADSNIHESLLHLAGAHFYMDAIVGITHRTLSVSHPVWKMIKPHMRHVVGTNRQALDSLVNTGGVFDSFTIGSQRLNPLYNFWYRFFDLSVAGHFYNDLTLRGVERAEILPNYRGRDDSLLYWDAIHDYVTNTVNFYYDTPEKLTGDGEIQSWNAEMGSTLNGFPDDLTTDALIELLTAIIFRASVFHAAVNNPQYEQLSLITNQPVRLLGNGYSTGASSEEAIMGQMDIVSTATVIPVLRLLTQTEHGRFGEYERVYAFPPSRVAANVEELRSVVENTIETEISWRNRLCSAPYTLLTPTRVPNSPAV